MSQSKSKSKLGRKYQLNKDVNNDDSEGENGSRHKTRGTNSKNEDWPEQKDKQGGNPS